MMDRSTRKTQGMGTHPESTIMMCDLNKSAVVICCHTDGCNQMGGFLSHRGRSWKQTGRVKPETRKPGHDAHGGTVHNSQRAETQDTH